MNQKLSNFSALLFDVDRTLTNTKREIPPDALDALKKLSQSGYQIGLCTGRGTAAIKNKILPLFPKNSFHVTTGGSQLIDSKGNVIWEHTIDEQSIKNLRKYLLENNRVATFMKNDAQYAKEPMLSNLKKHPWNCISKDLKEMTNNKVGAVYIPNINDDLLDYIKKDKNFSFKYMSDNFGNSYIDVTAVGANKAVTLKKWSKHLGIPLEKIIGFGDSLNDLEFLQACGFGVAMGNAVEEIKQIADRVIGHTDENGLAEYLLKIIQGENL
jgi:Cof subfamily protein (haloacid dehalogenase superfamily)